MTREEKQEQRDAIMKRLREESVQIFGGKPYVVLCQDRIYEFDSDEKSEVTRFHWSIENRSQSDFVRVREILFHGTMDKEMKENVERLYKKLVRSGVLRPPFLYRWSFLGSMAWILSIAICSSYMLEIVRSDDSESSLSVFDTLLLTKTREQLHYHYGLYPPVFISQTFVFLVLVAVAMAFSVAFDLLLQIFFDIEPMPNRHTPFSPYRSHVETRADVQNQLRGRSKIVAPIEWPLTALLKRLTF